jgi:hypothetical protein
MAVMCVAIVSKPALSELITPGGGEIVSVLEAFITV